MEKKKKRNEFLVGITPSSDGDLLHLSEGITDMMGISYLDIKEEDDENSD